ncbi:MAG: hypothetical protein ABR956_14440 [Terracidiphilus sp.]
MSDQFENSNEEKVENETDPAPTTVTKIERVAEKAAEKSSKTVQKFDQDHTIFSN